MAQIISFPNRQAGSRNLLRDNSKIGTRSILAYCGRASNSSFDHWPMGASPATHIWNYRAPSPDIVGIACCGLCPVQAQSPDLSFISPTGDHPISKPLILNQTLRVTYSTEIRNLYGVFYRVCSGDIRLTWAGATGVNFSFPRKYFLHKNLLRSEFRFFIVYWYKGDFIFYVVRCTITPLQ